MSLCPFCDLNHRREALYQCSFCPRKACDLHRSLYGGYVVCESCWQDFHSWRPCPDDLRALMDAQHEEMLQTFQRAGELIVRWQKEGMSQNEALERFWGKDVLEGLHREREKGL